MNLIDSLANQAFEKITQRQPEDFSSNSISNSELKESLSHLFQLLQTRQYYSTAIRYLCFICENPPKEAICLELLEECINASRIFLYKDMLLKRNPHLHTRNTWQTDYQKSFYTLDTGTVLTKDQKSLYNNFFRYRKLVASAPTSFGKSRITLEIISHSNYSQIAIVVPTNALLNETYQTLKTYPHLRKLKILTSIHTKPPQKDFITIFTPEKFDIYTDNNYVEFDLFIFDEIYKINDRDDRSSVFQNCLYKAYKLNCDYYLIGPFFKSFSTSFLDKTGGTFKRYTATTVEKKTFKYLPSRKIETNVFTLPPITTKDTRLKHIIKKVPGQHIVYTNRKSSAETIAKKISSFCPTPSSTINNNLKDLILHIKNNISNEWSLIKLLEKGIAFHHSGIPKYIQSEIIELFNHKALNFLCCTPTLTEGVNTSAKNITFYNITKSDKPLTNFDIKNITGRSGRFGQHFTGNAFFLEEPLTEEEDLEISFPLFDDPNLSQEDNLLIQQEDLNNSGLETRKTIIQNAQNHNISFDFLKSNKYIKIENQISLILHLREHPYTETILAQQGGRITHPQVYEIIELIHTYLFSKHEKQNNWTAKKLGLFATKQIFENPTIPTMISFYEAKNTDTKIRNTFTLIYKYFEFALPKYLKAFESIFNYTYNSKISLSHVSSLLQYGSTNTTEILLCDAGIPRSIVRKIGPLLQGSENISQIITQINTTPKITESLSSFEVKVLKKSL